MIQECCGELIASNYGCLCTLLCWRSWLHELCWDCQVHCSFQINHTIQGGVSLQHMMPTKSVLMLVLFVTHAADLEADMLRGMRNQYRCCVATLGNGAAARPDYTNLWGTVIIWVGEQHDTYVCACTCLTKPEKVVVLATEASYEDVCA